MKGFGDTCSYPYLYQWIKFVLVYAYAKDAVIIISVNSSNSEKK